MNYEEREYAFEKTPVKSYKKDLIFPLVKAVKVTNHWLKLAKGVFTIANGSVYSSAFQERVFWLESSKLVRNLLTYKQITEILNRLSNLSFA